MRRRRHLALPRPATLVLSGVLAWALLGCATRTSLSDVWKVRAELAPMRKVLVIGLARTETTRRLFEDRLAGALAERGVEAVPGYVRIPAGEPVGEASVRQAVRGQGYDGVLVTRLVAIDEDTHYVPPQTYVTGGAYYGRGLYGYVGGWGVETTPGYTVETTVVRLETHLYDAGSAELLWAAHSETFDPSSIEDGVSSVTKALGKRLASDGLVPGS